MATGKVTRFDADRGYGFIAPDDGGPDLFMHISELERGTDPRKIKPGTAMFFDVEEGGKGPKAVRVRPAGAVRRSEPANPTEREWRTLWDEMFAEMLDQARERGWVQD